jgi:hypothetical protein
MIAARLYVHRNLAGLPAAWFPAAGLVACLILWSFNRAGGWSSGDSWKLAWPTIEGAIWACVIVTYLPAGRSLPRWLGWLGAKVHDAVLTTLLVALPILIGIGLLTYYAIELPFLQRRSRYVTAESDSVAPGAPVARP